MTHYRTRLRKRVFPSHGIHFESNIFENWAFSVTSFYLRLSDERLKALRLSVWGLGYRSKISNAQSALDLLTLEKITLEINHLYVIHEYSIANGAIINIIIRPMRSRINTQDLTILKVCSVPSSFGDRRRPSYFLHNPSVLLFLIIHP